MLGAYSETALSSGAVQPVPKFLPADAGDGGGGRCCGAGQPVLGKKDFQADSPHYRRGSSLRGGDGRRDVSCGAVFPGTGTGTADE